MDLSTEVSKWKEYSALLMKHCRAKEEAEILESKRRAAWRKYFKLEEEMVLLKKELGIENIEEAFNSPPAKIEEESAPPAPKKLKFK